jgi:deoxyribonuclease-4
VLIGAHVSIRGGILTSIDNGLRIGADVIQTHPTSAVQWRPMALDERTQTEYVERYRASGLRGHWLHAVYLVNLASPKPELLRQSVASLVHYMDLAGRLEADGVVFHPGSHLGAGFAATRDQIVAAIREVLANSPPGAARLLVENSAGSGGCVGCSFEEIGAIVDGVDDERLGVCLDTQHAFASGYDLRDAASVGHALTELDRHIGFEHLALVHANDSRRPLASAVDRHANIGEGEIGVDGFRALLADGRLNRVPWLLEVPGVERSGPNRAQIDLLRSCAVEPATQEREAAAV